MANIHTINEINNGALLLENQYLKYDLDIALSLGIQLGTRNNLLIKNNESFSERVCQLEDEAREFKNEIN
ncbi:hypothetical protein RhiirA5_447380 [Rhizophagus irregularis]|uniref:Uncharacterized protein n=1 Tax=Rhizophagus irregularis TaxID=588596 RepID=A0A2N0NB83_9GLOM|nr:hypothetical protein RhiirA5_447380 [Rhizophagus irregularis]